MLRSAPALALVGLVAGIASAVAVAPAHAVGPTQGALCDGYVRVCGIDVEERVAGDQQLLQVRGTGHPGVTLELQFYVIEFNSRGEATGLVPSGEPVTTATKASGASGDGRFDTVKLVPRTLDDVPGGWGFVGLADDGSLDLSTRLGEVVEFSGRTLKLLGDGYAEQKPVDVQLEMQVLGNVVGTGYWVEYLDADGTWTPVPGHGYSAAQRLRNSPGEISAVTYTVPAGLTPGQVHRFRINHHLNYASSPDRPVARPAYAEWDVIPSEHGEARERGKQFDPTKQPGLPDPDPDPGQVPGGTAPPSASPPAPPAAGPSPTRSPAGGAPATRDPSGAASPHAQPGGGISSPAPHEAPPAAPPATSPAAPSVAASPGGSPTPGAVPVPPSASGADPGDPPVWGEEASTVAATGVEEARQSVRWLLALLLAAALAAPAGWFLTRRVRRVTRGTTW